MIKLFEKQYVNLVEKVLSIGLEKTTRNGLTKSIFASQLIIDNYENRLPLLMGRKIYYKGILGELAALLRGPKELKDFEKWGCNYWKQWADKDGKLILDYGNAWIDYNGVNQLQQVINKLKNNPSDRRIMINAWRPDRLDKLSLPCCHYGYQWYVNDGKLELLWLQRSADLMIGVPSDIILAVIFNSLIAREVGLKPGRITMSFGDTHIYEEHFENAKKYIQIVKPKLVARVINHYSYPLWIFRNHIEDSNKTIYDFEPDEVRVLEAYEPLSTLKFKLKA